MRFRYDGTKFKPSNIETNEVTDDVNSYFRFEEEFQEALDIFSLNYEEENVVNAVISFNPPIEETEHIIEKEDIGKVVTTSGGVLLGKMSFRMTAEEFDISEFSLVPDTNSPLTGIKINLNIEEAFENTSTFRFTDALPSKDSALSNLIVSSGVVDEENAENSTYKEYTLSPIFDKETLSYEIELLEYVDNLNIKATQSDENATMIIKVPKRDEENNLVYDTDGKTIIYEEKEMINDIPLEVVINKLGEPDTKLNITVTAEDGKTTTEYQLVIKRPYGTIKGSIQLGDGLRESMQASYGIYTKYIADANVYKSNAFNWEGIIDGSSSYDELDLIEKEVSVITNEDTGEYEIKVIPGTYDLQLERKGFLNSIVKNITVNIGDTIEIENKILYPGDVDRNGVVSLQDYTKVINRQDAVKTDETYGDEYDFGQKGYISLIDITTVLNHMDKLLSIENY